MHLKHLELGIGIQRWYASAVRAPRLSLPQARRENDDADGHRLAALHHDHHAVHQCRGLGCPCSAGRSHRMRSRKLQRKALEVGPCSYLALPTGYGGVMQAVLVRSLGRPAAVAAVAAVAAGTGTCLRGATCLPWQIVLASPAGAES